MGAATIAALLGTPSPAAESRAFGSSLPQRLPASTGAEYYVDGARGNDRNPGSLRRPWRTINHALMVVPTSGSKVFVRGGIYVGTVRYAREGDPANPITLRPVKGEQVVLTTGADQRLVNAVTITGGGFRLSGFEITAPTAAAGVRIDNSHDIEIVGCEVHHTGHGGLAVFGIGTKQPTVNRNIQVWNSRFHDNGGYWAKDDPYWLRGDHSIYWGGVSADDDGIDRSAYGGVIANNLFHDQPVGRALQIGSQVNGLIVTNNTFYRAYQPHPWAGTAIEFYGEGTQFDTQRVVVVNNIIANNAHYGVSGSGGNGLMATNLVRNNLAWGNPDGDFNPVYDSPDKVVFRLGPNLTGRPPLFLLPRALDFRLQKTSPAIDRADSSYAPRFDRLGRQRRGPADLGAYEWVPRRP